MLIPPASLRGFRTKSGHLKFLHSVPLDFKNSTRYFLGAAYAVTSRMLPLLTVQTAIRTRPRDSRAEGFVTFFAGLNVVLKDQGIVPEQLFYFMRADPLQPEMRDIVVVPSQIQFRTSRPKLAGYIYTPSIRLSITDNRADSPFV